MLSTTASRPVSEWPLAPYSASDAKGLLNEHFMYLLDMNGYAVIGHLDLLALPPE